MSGGYLPVLALNAAVEVACAAALAGLLGVLRPSALPGRGGRVRTAPVRVAAVALAVNLVTHPIFWFGLPLLPLAYGPKLIGGEIAVILVEGAAYAGPGRIRPAPLAFGLSAVVNAVSWFAGEWWLA